MYLPPKIDSVASNGFGGQIDVSNDKIGYGEVENVQGTFTTSPTTDFSNYGLSPTTTDDASDTQTTLGLFDTITRMSNEPVGSSLDQTNSYNTLSSGRNNFGQLSNKNNDYISGADVSGTNNNYGTSLGTKSIPNNNGVTAQPGTADGYGQNELLKIAQNQGLSKYNYNGATAASQFIQNPNTIGDQYSQQGTVENTAGSYGNIDFGASKASVQGNNQISGQNAYGQGGNGNIGPNRGQSFSVDNISYGNLAPNSFGKKYTNGEYSQNENGNIPNTHFSIEKSIDISNNTASIGSVPNIQTQNDPISKSISQFNNDIVNGKNGQNEFPNNRGFQAGGYNPELLSTRYGQYSSGSNQGVPAISQTYGQNDFEKPNSNSYSSNSKNLPFTGEPFSPLAINNGFEQSSTNAYNQKPIGINKNQIADTSNIGVQLPGTSYQNSYSQNSPDIQSFNQKQGLSNYEDGFNLNPPSQLQGSNNFRQSESYSIGNEENFGQSSPTYNEFYQNQKDQQLPNSYGPPAGPLQSFINGRNPTQSPTNEPANGEYNNQDRSSTGPNVFDQSSPTTSRVSNNNNQTEFQPPYSYSQSGSIPPLNDGYYQGSLLNVLNGFEQNSQSIPGGRPNNYGPVGSQVLPTTVNSFNQNSPTNGAYPQGAQSSEFYGGNVIKPNSENKGNIVTTQLSYSQNSFSTPSSGQESSSSFPSYSQGIKPCTSKNSGDVNKDKTSTGSPADPGYGIRNQKKHSTLVPKGQFQNSNSPSLGNGMQVSSNANNNGNNYGEPGLNSFSNFAPGNQPNQSINPGINNCDTNIHSNSLNEAIFSPSKTGY